MHKGVIERPRHGRSWAESRPRPIAGSNWEYLAIAERCSVAFRFQMNETWRGRTFKNASAQSVADDFAKPLTRAVNSAGP